MVQLTDDATKDDVALLTDAVRNFGKMVAAIDRLASSLVDIPQDVIVHVQYDDRIARSLESIADTLARLERQ
jgi:hypothetical protein